MLDRFSARTMLAAAGAALALGLAAAPPAVAAGAAASPAASLPPASVPGAPLPPASGTPVSGSTAQGTASAVSQAIGGAQLAARGVVVNYPSRSVRRLPDVHASAFVIADADTGQVLAARDPHGWYRPASTLKVLTAISLIPLLSPDATVVATKQAARAEPNDVGLIPGQAYKVSDLFTALLTISANDAAIALTQATGSFSKGMALINAEARYLQADDTVAVDPNGLDAPGQHTSAYDMALMARQALRLPAFGKYDQTITALFPVRKHKLVGLYNQNSLLTSYPGAIGGKIGWTSAADATYIGMARRHGVTLIVTLLHCPALTEITSAESLLNWGFAVDGKVAPVGRLVGPLRPPAPATVPTTVPAPTPAPAPAPARNQRAEAASHPAASPSVLTAAGFSCVAVVAAGFGFVYNRRQRLRAAGTRSPRGG